MTSDSQQESAEVGGPRDEGKRRDSGDTEVAKTRRIYVVVVVPLLGMPRSLHLVTSLRLRLGIISFTIYPTKNELNTCLESLCQVLGNHRCHQNEWRFTKERESEKEMP